MAEHFATVTPVNTAVFEVSDEDGWHTASIRFDGCIHFYRYFNAPKSERTKEFMAEHGDMVGEPDYLHICDVDEIIEMLQEIKAKAKVYFGADWK